MSDLLAFNADFTGVVVAGDKRGRTLGYPTANIDVTAGDVIPVDGIYACLVNFQPAADWHPATLSIGTNPTFEDVGDRRVEVFIHELSSDVYGFAVGVKVTRRLRNTIRFNSAEELISRSADDVRRSSAALEQFLQLHNRSGLGPDRPKHFSPGQAIDSNQRRDYQPHDSKHSDEVIEP